MNVTATTNTKINVPCFLDSGIPSSFADYVSISAAAVGWMNLFSVLLFHLYFVFLHCMSMYVSERIVSQ